jgi:hypothetical protein
MPMVIGAARHNAVERIPPLPLIASETIGCIIATLATHGAKMTRSLWWWVVAVIGVGMNSAVFAAGDLFDTTSQIRQIQKAIDRSLDDVAQKLPPDEKKQFHLVAKRLNDISLNDLYFLKAVESCEFSSLVICKPLKTEQVKLLVESEIERRKEVLAEENASTSRYISLAGFGVSAFSLVVSFLSFRQKKAESKSAQPAKKDDGDMASTAP